MGGGGGAGRGVVPHFQMLCSDACASPSRTKIVAKDNDSHLAGLTQNIFQLVLLEIHTEFVESFGE